jgi:arylsulfatase A-like enzyme
MGVALLLGGVGFSLLGGRLLDRDGDGAWGRWHSERDCDDGDPTVHPRAIDLPLNARDEDCDGFDSIRGSNVVLITIDTLRARNLGAYGYSRDTSPHIDALSREGALFLEAFSSSSWTIPSLASLLTSLHPHQHQLRMYLKSSRWGIGGFREDLPVLTEVLRRAGYETALFFDSAYPLAQIGLARGFNLVEEQASIKTSEIQRWIEKRRQRKFFLWLHYLKPHVPYSPSPRFDRLFIEESLEEHSSLAVYWDEEECRARYGDPALEVARIRLGFYDESIRDSDLLVGEILAALAGAGLAERTLVVLGSDHGEEFFEHGGCDHGMTLYDEVLHIPLVFRHPLAIPKGLRINGQVRLIDVAPTILNLLELEPPDGFVGESLVGHLRGKERDLPVLAGFLTSGEPTVSLRHDGLKYVHSPWSHREELYDLRVDPMETENVIKSRHHKLREFREAMQAWLAGSGQAPAQLVPFDAETLERLDALGYRVDPERK